MEYHVRYHLQFQHPCTMHLSKFFFYRSADGGKYADGVNWDDLSFKVTPTDYIYTMKCNDGDEFSQGYLIPHGNIELCPFAGILNYGQVSKHFNLLE